MSVKGIRAGLAADPLVGAGNVLTSLIHLGIGLDEPVLTFDTPVDAHPAGTALTVRELDRAVRARAAALHALGVGPRDPVVIYAGAAADHVLGFLAAARLGAIPALLNPNVPGERAAEYINRLSSIGVLSDAVRRERLEGRGLTVPHLADVAELGRGDPDAAPEPYRHWDGDPVAITHSSGTTGMPKAVVHSHASLYAAIRYRLSLPRPQGSERMLSVLPAPHAATLIALNLALSAHAEIFFLSEQTGEAVLDAIERWRPRGVVGFAATWADLAGRDLGLRALDSVALWWNTGDCAHETHIRTLIRHGSRQVPRRLRVGGEQTPARTSEPGSVFVDGLGSTEMGHSHFFITHTPDSARYGRCVGKPHEFVDCAVLGPDGRELPIGEVGELGTKSPTLALGYWNDSATTYRTRVRGYFLTGDLMYRDEEGYYYHMDRLVDSVDLGGGHRLYTAMSEERVLAACPEVLDCTVVAVRDPDAGTVVTDVLLQLAPHTHPDAGPDVEAKAEEERRARIEAALGPRVAATLRRVVVVDDEGLPLGPTGKVRKNELRARHLAEAAAS
jgi:acyl-coenzyme A synthetase/AMP-(fatty) acid ligase